MADLKALFERLVQESGKAPAQGEDEPLHPPRSGPRAIYKSRGRHIGERRRSNPDDDRQDPMIVHGSGGGGEEALWVAVLLQAFSDARSQTRERWAARAFLLDKPGARRAADREEICAILGLDPDWLRRKAEEFLDKADAVDADWRGEGRRKGYRAISRSPGMRMGHVTKLKGEEANAEPELAA